MKCVNRYLIFLHLYRLLLSRMINEVGFYVNYRVSVPLNLTVDIYCTSFASNLSQR